MAVSGGGGCEGDAKAEWGEWLMLARLTPKYIYLLGSVVRARELKDIPSPLPSPIPQRPRKVPTTNQYSSSHFYDPHILQAAMSPWRRTWPGEAAAQKATCGIWCSQASVIYCDSRCKLISLASV